MSKQGLEGGKKWVSWVQMAGVVSAAVLGVSQVHAGLTRSQMQAPPEPSPSMQTLGFGETHHAFSDGLATAVAGFLLVAPFALSTLPVLRRKH